MQLLRSLLFNTYMILSACVCGALAGFRAAVFGCPYDAFAASDQAVSYSRAHFTGM